MGKGRVSWRLSKLKDMADFITEEKGYLLFNPVVKKEDFISTTENPISNVSLDTWMMR